MTVIMNYRSRQGQFRFVDAQDILYLKSKPTPSMWQHCELADLANFVRDEVEFSGLFVRKFREQLLMLLQ
jgi:hypothetical protein